MNLDKQLQEVRIYENIDPDENLFTVSEELEKSTNTNNARINSTDETNGDEFQIFVKLESGKTIRLFVTSAYTMKKLVRMIGATLDEDEQFESATWLFYGGTPLQDEMTLKHYGIEAEATLFLNGRILGGGVDGGKFARLSNLFINTIRGMPNYDNLMDQFNKLNICNTVGDLKAYDTVYQQHRI